MGETREAIVYRLAEDMLEKLPPDYIAHEVTVFKFYKRIADMGILTFFEAGPLRLMQLLGGLEIGICGCEQYQTHMCGCTKLQTTSIRS